MSRRQVGWVREIIMSEWGGGGGVGGGVGGPILLARLRVVQNSSLSS